MVDSKAGLAPTRGAHWFRHWQYILTSLRVSRLWGVSLRLLPGVTTWERLLVPSTSGRLLCWWRLTIPIGLLTTVTRIRHGERGWNLLGVRGWGGGEDTLYTIIIASNLLQDWHQVQCPTTPPPLPSYRQMRGTTWTIIYLWQGIVTCVACWNTCDHDQNLWVAKSVLDRLIVVLRLLIAWFSGVKSQIAAACTWSTDLRHKWSRTSEQNNQAIKHTFCRSKILIAVANASTWDI